MEKIEADEAATGDAWYDEEEEEAMLRQEEERAEGAVADEEEARTNANAAITTSAWLVRASVPAMSKWLALKIVYGVASQKDFERKSKR